MQVHCLVNSDISALESNGRTELQAIPLVSACAIPRSRFAIALAQSNLRAIPRSRFAIALYQSKLQAIPAERFAIAIYQFNLRAIPAERFAIALIAVMLTVKRLQNIYFPVFQL